MNGISSSLESHPARSAKSRVEFLVPAEGKESLDLVRRKEPSPDRLAQLIALTRTAQEQVHYHSEAADILAEIAGWSYSGGETLIAALRHRSIVGPDATWHQVSVENDAMLVVSTAYFIQSGHVGVLSFRGTEPSNVINFLTDASVQMRAVLSMGHVHGGFYRNARAVWGDVATRIATALEPTDGRPGLEALYITGHSLGAAMAVIAAATIFGDERFVAWRPIVCGVYTYGQPMVGDKEFARSCDERFGRMLFRHVYQHDLVPRMPPVSTGTFKHSGNEYVGSLDGWVPRERAVAQALTALISVPIGAAAFVFRQIPVLHRIKLPFSIDDHSPNSYLEAFRATREAAHE